MSKKELEKKFKNIFSNKAHGWKNSVKGWHIQNAAPGLYTLDIEHIPDFLVEAHNNSSNSEDSIGSHYRKDLCLHKCPYCFNEENVVYSKKSRIFTTEETFDVIDQAISIAEQEGHRFESVKFLGPGELLMNPQLFQIIKEYKKRNVHIGIFTKGALLGSDELAKKYQNLSAKELTDKLANYENVSLIFSFQSFNDQLQNKMVTTQQKDGSVKGLQNYSKVRDEALANLFSSAFYNDGKTNRMSIINAPIVPENIDESFDIYRFFTERATPVIMTTSMVSGKGCNQIKTQDKIMHRDEWHNKLVELYAKIYAYNIQKGMQTIEETKKQGIASYAGSDPCNQVSTGLYIRANGLVQMCPGRFDNETIYGSLREQTLEEIWKNSPNKKRGIINPYNLVNNRCPAKDGRAFPENFYESVMARLEKILK